MNLPKSPSTATRLSDHIFLLGGKDLESLTRLNQLPTVRQVLLRFHFYLQEKNSVRNASYATVEEVNLLWSKAVIPTRLPKHGVEKIEKFHSEWLLIKKNKSRTSKTQKEREQKFTSNLDTLFDIAHADSLSMIKINEDKEFLKDQREERKMVMTNVDKDLVKKQERSLKRQAEEEARKCKAARASCAGISAVALTTQPNASASLLDGPDENEEVTCDEVSSDEEYTPDKRILVKIKPSSGKKNQLHKIKSKQSLFTPQVTSALDRNKVSDREAVRLMIPVAAALGQDPLALPISRSTIRRERKKARKELAENIKESFRPDQPLVVHWDGKILPEIVGTETVDRLPILVTGDGQEKLLGVPKVASGSGENCAEAIFAQLQQWGLADKVQAMCFDTTAANTGLKKGACTLLEDKLGRKLLWLACRHHMMELILAKIFSICLGPSSSPEIPLFKRFKTVWGGIDRDNFQPLETDCNASVFKQNTLEYLLEVENWKSQPRDDYIELVELTLTILGKTVDEMLEGFRGRCKFRQYIRNKPDKYGIKIYALVDARTFFTLNMEIYAGKQPKQSPYELNNSASAVVQRLIKPIDKTGRNITMDNYFTSIPLANDLFAYHKTTIVGTIRKNKAQLPQNFLEVENRPVKSSIFGFGKAPNNTLLVSYVPKKKKNVLMLSTLHDDDSIDPATGEDYKPEVITFYNVTKGGVDVVDRKKKEYSVKRVNNRWPLVIFCGLLDLSTVNAQIIYFSNTGDSIPRRKFIKTLAMELVKPHLLKRASVDVLSIGLRQSIKNVLGQELPVRQRLPVPDVADGRKPRCAYCPVRKNRFSAIRCHECQRPICKEHTGSTTIVCSDCHAQDP